MSLHRDSYHRAICHGMMVITGQHVVTWWQLSQDEVSLRDGYRWATRRYVAPRGHRMICHYMIAITGRHVATRCMLLSPDDVSLHDGCHWTACRHIVTCYHRMTCQYVMVVA